jgi:hypothetical protein
MCPWRAGLGNGGFVSISQETDTSGYGHQYYVTVHTRELDIETELTESIGHELENERVQGVVTGTAETFSKDMRTQAVRATCIRNASRIAIAVANVFDVELEGVRIDNYSFKVDDCRKRDKLDTTNNFAALAKQPASPEISTVTATYLWCPDAPIVDQESIWIFSECASFNKRQGSITLMGCTRGVKGIRSNNSPGNYKRANSNLPKIVSMRPPKRGQRTSDFTPIDTARAGTIYWTGKYGSEYYRGMHNIYDVENYEKGIKQLFGEGDNLEVDFVPFPSKFTFVSK